MYGRSVCGNREIHTPDGTGFADWRSTRSGRPGGGNTEVRLTHRWSKADSNPWSPPHGRVSPRRTFRMEGENEIIRGAHGVPLN